MSLYRGELTQLPLCHLFFYTHKKTLLLLLIRIQEIKTMSKSIKNEKYRDLLCYAAQFIRDNNLTAIEGATNSVLAYICGKKSVIIWRVLDFNELELTIWWGFKNDTIPETIPILLKQSLGKLIDASASGYLEQNEGLWIQGKDLHDLICSRCYCSKDSFEDLRCVPTYQGPIHKTGPMIY